MLDQWSHTDDGQLVTAVLTDGSEITATDHHLFWVANDGGWVELEDVGPGDTLLTPDGVTTVAHVVTWPQAEQLVWELDTAGPDTFTVSTGATDVLVHNADDKEPNWKKVSGQFLKDRGISAHDEKRELNYDSKYDIYIDKNSGELAVARKGLPGGKVVEYLNLQIVDGKVTRNRANC